MAWGGARAATRQARGLRGARSPTPAHPRPLPAAPPEHHLLVDARKQWALSARSGGDARRRRLVAWLQRRGHAWGDIRQIMHQLEREDAGAALGGGSSELEEE